MSACITVSIDRSAFQQHVDRPTTALAPLPIQANGDDQMVSLWLNGRSPATQRAYAADAQRLHLYTGKPMATVTLADLQGFAESLLPLSPASQSRTLAAVKSLFHFAHELGYLRFDAAKMLKLPKQKSVLAERILSERAVMKMLGEKHGEEKPAERRNRVILTVLYASGARVSELCGLRWRDAQERDDGGQLALFGKCGKTRTVRLPASVWADLLELKGDAGEDAPIFRSREGGHLDQCQVNRIVHQAAAAAKLPAGVSPHWLRHAHASHAIERGAPVHLVQSTLGHASVATTGRYLHARPGESSGKYLGL